MFARYSGPIAINMVALAEESANPEYMFREMLDHYDDNLHLLFTTLSDTIGPMFIMGLATIAICFALFLCSCHLPFYVGYEKMDMAIVEFGYFPMLKLQKRAHSLSRFIGTAGSFNLNLCVFLSSGLYSTAANDK
jgi:hypothetical protein